MNEFINDVGSSSRSREWGDTFLDRNGRPITIAEWVRKRRDPDYCVVAQWEGEGGASVLTLWLGMDATPRTAQANFATVISAFEKCPRPDYFFRWTDEEYALKRHADIVWLVERGIKPWDGDAVRAAEIDPLR